MAIYIPRKAPFSCNFKWLPITSYSVSSSDYAKLAYANTPGNLVGRHASDRCCGCTNTNAITSMTNCRHTKTVGLTSAINSTQTAGSSTPTEMCARKKLVDSIRNSSHFALHRGSFVWNNVHVLRVSPTSYAMLQMPSYALQGLFCNVVNHIQMHSTNTEARTQCCSCGKYKSEKGFLICPSCNAVQALNPAISYFQIFDLDEKFELDLKELEAKYKSLMKKLHPDLSHGKSTEDKENCAQLSALVTTAYNELLKPVSRATYMLKLRGIHVEDEGTVTDSELIMEVMEIRETLQSSPDRKTLQQLLKTAATKMDEWSEAFKSALKEGNDTKAVGALQRMSYFGRVCEDISRELL